MFYDDNVVKIRNTSIAVPVKQTFDVNGVFVQKILDFVRENYQILDIGTGNGFVLKQIQENSLIKCALTGVDNSEDMVKVAKANLGNNANVLVANNENLPFEDGSFDIITAKNVTRFEASELFRVLKNGGYFVFREYGKSKGLCEIASLFEGRLIRSRDVSFYSTKLQDAGFEIVSIECFEVSKKYSSVQEIINITKSFPFIRDYSKEDEEAIKRKLNGNCTITSDPFILVAKK